MSATFTRAQSAGRLDTTESRKLASEALATLASKPVKIAAVMYFEPRTASCMELTKQAWSRDVQSSNHRDVHDMKFGV